MRSGEQYRCPRCSITFDFFNEFESEKDIKTLIADNVDRDNYQIKA